LSIKADVQFKTHLSCKQFYNMAKGDFKF